MFVCAGRKDMREERKLCARQMCEEKHQNGFLCMWVLVGMCVYAYGHVCVCVYTKPLSKRLLLTASGLEVCDSEL